MLPTPAQTLVGAGAVEVVDVALDVAAAHEAPYRVSKGFASSYYKPAMSFQDLMHAPGYSALVITCSDYCRSCGWLYQGVSFNTCLWGIGALQCRLQAPLQIASNNDQSRLKEIDVVGVHVACTRLSS